MVDPVELLKRYDRWRYAVRATIGATRKIPVTTVPGWQEFRVWAAGISAGKYPELHRLIWHGSSRDLPRLEKELEHAQPPAAIAKTAARLIKILRAAPRLPETIAVGDGMLH